MPNSHSRLTLTTASTRASSVTCQQGNALPLDVPRAVGTPALTRDHSQHLGFLQPEQNSTDTESSVLRQDLCTGCPAACSSSMRLSEAVTGRLLPQCLPLAVGTVQGILLFLPSLSRWLVLVPLTL